MATAVAIFRVVRTYDTDDAPDNPSVRVAHLEPVYMPEAAPGKRRTGLIAVPDFRLTIHGDAGDEGLVEGKQYALTFDVADAKVDAPAEPAPADATADPNAQPAQQ
jgi:hypothetical protein